MLTLDVNLGDRGYPVLIGSGLLNRFGDLLGPRLVPTSAVVVSDHTVAGLYAERLLTSLGEAGCRTALLEVAPGESSKSLAVASQLYDQLSALGVDRQSAIIALGGGVVGDLSGFVAATWLRGLPFVQVPTTLEADIDASVGGKTAVNHPSGKNLIGAFHQPRLVIIDVECLRTLDKRDLRAGLAESIKHAAIRDADFFVWQRERANLILGGDEAVLAELIQRNCRIKAEVVAEDEREAGLRAILNFGHTIGHAIEAECQFGLRHGECVALGMIAANHIATHRGLLDPDQARQIRDLTERLQLPCRLPQRLDADALGRRMRHDKKFLAGHMRFVLVDRIGQARIVDDVGNAEVVGALVAIQP
ncbi:MAG TPA: 3-dehydroquinate synthase [Phycisphaerae bacterium]|nr:3-dehydroquinate synthase [Phycisphaerae bacterium]